MPAAPRYALIDYASTRFYHCMSRCVRRIFLCGEDGGVSYDHRKAWFVEKLGELSRVFTVDVCAYAIMSNHFHLVLRADIERADRLSDEAVLRRYGRLFPFAAAAARELAAAARAVHVAELRRRLCDVSWFMRVINEHVARRANAEDGCTGRFWEGRFKSQALLTDASIYMCMSYVDLNPVRAGITESLEGSDFTSIQQRLRAAAARARGRAMATVAAIALAPLTADGSGGGPNASGGRAIEMRFDDYVALLDWSGRATRAKPGGTIRGAPPDVLTAIGVNHGAWVETMAHGRLSDLTRIGDPASLDADAARRGAQWVKGKRRAADMFRSA